jgi:hypothetical protein
MVKLSNMFEILVSGVEGPAASLLEQCGDLMTPEQFDPSTVGRDLPQYDEGRLFFFRTDDNTDALMTVLIRDDRVLQAGVTVTYSRPLIARGPLKFFSLRYRHFRRILRRAEDRYGPGIPITLGNTTIFNFDDDTTVFHVLTSPRRTGDVMVFRSGDKNFWTSEPK